MKNIFFSFLILFTISSFSQIVIRGTVYDIKGPLEGAAVYFNNTMIGTTANEKGEFSIPVKEGQHQLIISYLGYKTISYALNTATYNKPLTFALVEEENMLDEIIIKKTVYDDEWKYNLQRFEQEFIGRTELAKDCKIVNPKVLHFNYNAKEQILTAIPRKPLEIIHKGLGYKIIYDLVDFTINKNYVSYLGYSRYEQLKGSKRKQKRWKKNRLQAYNGSAVHFYKSAMQDKIYEEGFIVNQFKRVANPERPSEKEIKKARALVRLSRSSINFTKKIDTPKTAIDSALLVLRKVRLPKFKDYLYKSKVPQSEIISIKDNIPYLEFKDNIMVVYTKEKEEEGFILRNAFSKPRKATFQTSSIIPLERPSAISKDGTLYNPLDIYYEGYWGYEKFGNMLPLDYVPVSSKQ
ncbi:MAG: carboxypeptidase-like regulatory domain-containing protein [Polaribacter sp.]